MCCTQIIGIDYVHYAIVSLSQQAIGGDTETHSSRSMIILTEKQPLCMQYTT